MVKQRSTVLLQFVEMQLIVVQEEEEDDCKHQEWETVLAPDDNYGNKRRCDGSASHGQEIGCRTSKWPAEHHRDFTFNLEGGSCVKCTFHVCAIRWQDNIVNGRSYRYSSHHLIINGNIFCQFRKCCKFRVCWDSLKWYFDGLIKWTVVSWLIGECLPTSLAHTSIRVAIEVLPRFSTNVLPCSW